jgi:hypothetical protein
MGDRRQYARLLSKQFSDAEAVIEWLDAGVILATGRSDHHRRLRSFEDAELPGRRPPHLERLFSPW